MSIQNSSLIMDLLKILNREVILLPTPSSWLKSGNDKCIYIPDDIKPKVGTFVLSKDNLYLLTEKLDIFKIELGRYGKLFKSFVYVPRLSVCVIKNVDDIVKDKVTNVEIFRLETIM